MLDAIDAPVGADEHLVVLAALWNVRARDRQVRVAVRVRLDQRPVVERVDLIAGEHEHVARADGVDEVAVLINGIDGAAVPTLAILLLRRPDLDELPELAMQEAPAVVHVANQGLGLVLRQQSDLANLGVDAVREHEIHDAVLPAERDCGFGLPGREPFERSTAAIREDEGEHAFAASIDGEATGAIHRSPLGHCKKRGSDYRVCNRPPKMPPGITHSGGPRLNSLI